jgi:hypothetical protein
MFKRIFSQIKNNHYPQQDANNQIEIDSEFEYQFKMFI